MSFFRLSGTILPREVAGQGIVLRALRNEDYEDWADLRARSRGFLEPWEPIWPEDDLTRGAFRRRVRRYADEAAGDGAYPFLIWRQADGALLGGLTLGLIRRGVSQTATLGYWIGAPFAGQGYMSAAVRAGAAHAFGPLHLRRIEAACVPTNAASIRVLEKVGFMREGLAREYLCINGIWQDHLLYALLRKDLAAPPGEGGGGA